MLLLRVLTGTRVLAYDSRSHNPQLSGTESLAPAKQCSILAVLYMHNAANNDAMCFLLLAVATVEKSGSGRQTSHWNRWGEVVLCLLFPTFTIRRSYSVRESRRYCWKGIEKKPKPRHIFYVRSLNAASIGPSTLSHIRQAEEAKGMISASGRLSSHGNGATGYTWYISSIARSGRLAQYSRRRRLHIEPGKKYETFVPSLERVSVYQKVYCCPLWVSHRQSVHLLITDNGRQLEYRRRDRGKHVHPHNLLLQTGLGTFFAGVTTHLPSPDLS